MKDKPSSGPLYRLVRRRSTLALAVVALVVVGLSLCATGDEPFVIVPAVEPDIGPITVVSFQGDPYKQINIGSESTIERVEWSNKRGDVAVITWDGDHLSVKMRMKP